MKAILIDPTNQTVSEVETDGEPSSVYKLLGCDLVDIVLIPHGNMLIVDDEGLLKPNRLFIISGYSNPLAGKSLLVGDNNNDFKQAPRVTLEEAQRMVTFTSLRTHF